MTYDLVYVISVKNKTKNKTTWPGNLKEDWGTLRDPFLHKTLVQSFNGADFVLTVCAHELTLR